MPLQPFMNQYGGGYYPVGQGQGVNQDPSWPAISQNQSFLGPWSQMPQPTTTTSPVTVGHTGILSPTSASHVGDWSTTSASHVEDHAGGTTSTLQVMLGAQVSPPLLVMLHIHHQPLLVMLEICHQPLQVMLGAFIRLRSLDVSDVRPDSFAGLAKEVTLLICVLLLLGYQKHGSHLRALQVLICGFPTLCSFFD
jgi:hypothetical protein